MNVSYSDHHAHLSLSSYSDSGVNRSIECQRYNINTDIDVGVDQISIPRRLSFPYFFTPSLTRSSFSLPILHRHLHSNGIEFPNSLTHNNLSSGSSDQSLVCSTENDDVIMMTGSHDNHVIELPELRQPAICISDSVPPYLNPSSSPPPTHTPQSHIIPITNSGDVIGTASQEMGSSGGEHRAISNEDRHRLDFQNGRIDYAGVDSFENIQRRLDALLVNKEEEHGGTVEEQVGLGEGSVTIETTEAGDA